jgi:Tn3 transposase DDE domain
MAASSHGVTRDQLICAKDAHIREENHRAALACLINAHHRLTLAAVWGEGTTSSSDGQFFRGGKRVAPGGDVNARYGVDPASPSTPTSLTSTDRIMSPCSRQRPMKRLIPTVLTSDSAGLFKPFLR